MAVLPPDVASNISHTPDTHNARTTRKTNTSVSERGVVFATAGDKGVIRLWNTLNSDPIQTLQPLGVGVGDGSVGEPGAPQQTYTGLLYRPSHGLLVGLTDDHRLLFYDQGEEFRKTKQVSKCTNVSLVMCIIGHI